MESEGADKLEKTNRTKLRRFPLRGKFDKKTIFAILDKAPIAHIAFQFDTPAILPMAFWRDDGHVYFHGSATKRMFGAIATNRQCCFEVTLLDGFVAARAALHHSVNYRSVIIYGAAEEVIDRHDRLDALKGLIERFYPGRWAHIRPPSASELSAVRIFRLPISEASAKIRDGFPTPYQEDFGIPVWAGVIPVEAKLGTPRIDPNCAPGTPQADFSRLQQLVSMGGAEAE